MCLHKNRTEYIINKNKYMNDLLHLFSLSGQKCNYPGRIYIDIDPHSINQYLTI